MVCEDIEILEFGFIDLPNVTALGNGNGSSIQIFSSGKWNKFNRLPELFVSIVSHESIHLILSDFDGGASEALDEIGSVSAISRDWRGLAKCAPYYHGIVGLDKLVK